MNGLYQRNKQIVGVQLHTLQTQFCRPWFSKKGYRTNHFLKKFTFLKFLKSKASDFYHPKRLWTYQLKLMSRNLYFSECIRTNPDQFDTLYDTVHGKPYECQACPMDLKRPGLETAFNLCNLGYRWFQNTQDLPCKFKETCVDEELLVHCRWRFLKSKLKEELLDKMEYGYD